MKIENTADALKDFLSADFMSLLVDGPWGIGKTHKLMDFLQSVKSEKGLMTAYVSLFGADMEEIRARVYRAFHPHKARGRLLAGAIPKAAAVVEKTGGAAGQIAGIVAGLQSVLRVPRGKLTAQGKRYLAIFDDFERLDFHAVPLPVILGYFNDLIMQGVKLIVVCNEREIEADKKVYSAFKEKIFDREFHIVATDEEIMQSYFQEDVTPFADAFGGNLRIAARAGKFYASVMSALAEAGPDHPKKYPAKMLLGACILVVTTAQTAEQGEDNANADLIADDIARDSPFLAEKLKIALKQNKDRYSAYLIFALLCYYYFNDLEQLIALTAPADEDIYARDVFFLSDEKKKKAFEVWLSRILAGETPVQLPSMLQYLYKYAEISGVKEKEDKLIEVLSHTSSKRLDLFLTMPPPKEMEEFKEKLQAARRTAARKAMCIRLAAAWKALDYDRLDEALTELEYHADYAEMPQGAIFCEEIMRVIAECEYFLARLDGEISDMQWEVAHHVVRLAKRSHFEEDVKRYISSLDLGGDLSAKMRYGTLLSVLDKG